MAHQSSKTAVSNMAFKPLTEFDLTESELCVSVLAWCGEERGAGWLMTTVLLSISFGEGGGLARSKESSWPCSHRL